MNEFSRLHPAVCFVYFVLLIASAVTLCVFLSLLGSASYLIITQRSRGVRFITRAVLPLALLTALFNPLFSHAGVTILAYFPSGNPFTLESVYYGFDAAGILAAMLCLCACVGHVMTEEKWICVLGRVFGHGTMEFYPRMDAVFTGVSGAVLYIAFAVLALFPSILEMKEKLTWRCCGLTD